MTERILNFRIERRRQSRGKTIMWGLEGLTAHYYRSLLQQNKQIKLITLKKQS
jgi:hypothetical protein